MTRRSRSSLLIAAAPELGPEATGTSASARCAPARDIRLWPRRRRRSGRHRLCVRLEAAARIAGGFSQPQGDLLARRRRRSSASTDPSTAATVPLVRIVDPDLTMRMTEYVVLHVLMHHRRQRLYDDQQRQRLWLDHAATGGERGRASASWGSACSAAMPRGAARASASTSRAGAGRRRTIPGIETFAGADGLDRSWRAPRSWSACCRTRRRPTAS